MRESAQRCFILPISEAVQVEIDNLEKELAEVRKQMAEKLKQIDRGN